MTSFPLWENSLFSGLAKKFASQTRRLQEENKEVSVGTREQAKATRRGERSPGDPLRQRNVQVREENKDVNCGKAAVVITIISIWKLEPVYKVHE